MPKVLGCKGAVPVNRFELATGSTSEFFLIQAYLDTQHQLRKPRALPAQYSE